MSFSMTSQRARSPYEITRIYYGFIYVSWEHSEGEWSSEHDFGCSGHLGGV